MGCSPIIQKKTELDLIENLLDSIESQSMGELDFITIQLKKELLYDKYTLEDAKHIWVTSDTHF